MTINLTKLIRAYLANPAPATAIEYSLIAALIALAIIGGLTALGTNISTPFEDASAGL